MTKVECNPSCSNTPLNVSFDKNLLTSLLNNLDNLDSDPEEFFYLPHFGIRRKMIIPEDLLPQYESLKDWEQIKHMYIAAKPFKNNSILKGDDLTNKKLKS